MPTNVNFNRARQRRVVFYGRVSTEHEAQLSALENQMQWYSDQAKYHPNWNVIDKYIEKNAKEGKDSFTVIPGLYDIYEDFEKGGFNANLLSSNMQGASGVCWPSGTGIEQYNGS